jgi:Concanavalin A-like lectin/glucanases superfamily
MSTTSGKVIDNEVGNGPKLVIQGNDYTLGVPGPMTTEPSTGIRFGSDTYARPDYADAFAFANLHPFTFMVWAELNAPEPDAFIAAVPFSGGANSTGYSFEIVERPGLDSFVRTGYSALNGQNVSTLSSGIAAGSWRHLALGFDGSTLTTYVDGDQRSRAALPVGTVGYSAVSPVFLVATSPLYGGMRGALANLVVYDRALTVADLSPLALR